MTETTSPVVVRHPVRGVIWGLIAGFGVAIVLSAFSVIAIGTLTPIVVVVIVAILGGAWAWFAPPKDAASRSTSTEPTPVED
jgi:hypothetical protein